ncbi:hypothetical protein DWW00_15885 [Bacteroides fragilis]|uniref:Uncharacterized protein n=1 Tax=Bacteroides fragilis TaxID=817 RepID=A0A412XW13_BACFG|nr:hypothetical protein DWW08_18905 [Bacteroides fragilis]RGV84474.1 hypothetical protein DWW00_15885 [Bacteroides fragilis]
MQYDMFHFGESVYWTYKMCSPEPLPLLIDEKKGDKNQYMGCGWKRSAKQNEIKFNNFSI